MIHRAIGFFAVVCAAIAFAPAADGPIELFNGKDLTGWVNVNCAADTFAVRDGEIVTTGQRVTWEQALNSKEDLSPPHYEWGPLPIPTVAVPGKTKVV